MSFQNLFSGMSADKSADASADALAIISYTFSSAKICQILMVWNANFGQFFRNNLGLGA